MKYEQFVKEIAKKLDMTQSTARTVVDAVFEHIELVVLTDKDRLLTPLGSFVPVKKAPRKVWIPSKNTTVDVPEGLLVKFWLGAGVAKDHPEFRTGR